MSRSQHFDIGFLITEGDSEHLFISVSPGFEYGPGIQRDGIGSPRMTDPHAVHAVANHFKLHEIPRQTTTNAFVQRAGTRTLYHHLKEFIDRHKDWRVVGVQSNGDLTMNYWHLAYIRDYHGPYHPTVCALLTEGDPQEDTGTRTYRSLVKWDQAAAKILGRVYETVNLRFNRVIGGWSVRAADRDATISYDEAFTGLERYNSDTHDLGPLIEFSLAGKTVVEGGLDISLASAIDKFDDVRHVFNLPEADARGHYRGYEVNKVNFGEYQLFKYPNERRAALYTPIIINLDLDGYVLIDPKKVTDKLLERHYRVSDESPTRRGQFCRYDETHIEIFFPHNVYPFGVIGLRPSSPDTPGTTELVGLSSGGLSGRVGNTLEGITQIMYDFFGCTDAMVLDEGYDVFFVRNPPVIKGDPSKVIGYQYTNQELLDRVLLFTKKRAEMDADEASRVSKDYIFGAEMERWPLNKGYFQELADDFRASQQCDFADIMMVTPNRSQMRSVLIFAVHESRLPSQKEE